MSIVKPCFGVGVGETIDACRADNECFDLFFNALKEELERGGLSAHESGVAYLLSWGTGGGNAEEYFMQRLAVYFPSMTFVFLCYDKFPSDDFDTFANAHGNEVLAFNDLDELAVIKELPLIRLMFAVNYCRMLATKQQDAHAHPIARVLVAYREYAEQIRAELNFFMKCTNHVFPVLRCANYTSDITRSTSANVVSEEETRLKLYTDLVATCERKLRNLGIASPPPQTQAGHL
jgi:hypothetical protein